METKTGNRVMKIQMDFSAMGPTIFELWVMETELWLMETENPNSPLVFLDLCWRLELDKFPAVI